MNNLKYCKKRDNSIIAALENWHCLDTFQLAIMFFPSQKMARKRLLELYKRKKIKRTRIDIDQPNVYYLDRADETILKINWARLYLERKCAYGDTPAGFDYSTLVLTYENPLNHNKRQVKIETSKRKLNLSGNVFFADDKKIEEIREVLLCGRQ